MSSTLTGNYDVCVEITEAVLSGFAASSFGGSELTIPFNRTLSGQTVAGSVHLLVQSAAMTASPGQSPFATVTIAFTDSTITIASPAAGQAAPLNGTIIASVPFKLGTPAGGNSNLQLDFADPNVSVTVSPDAQSLQRLQALMQQFGVPAGLAGYILNQAMQQALASDPGTVNLPLSFSWTPGANGSLNPPVFTDMALVTRPAAGGRPGVLSILGTMLTGHVGAESRSNKTGTATDAAHQGSLTISPEAFRDLIFCPNLAGRSGIAVSSLCPTCGTAGSVSMDGINLTRIDATLQEGSIRISGNATDSGTGWSATATFSATATLGISGGVITPAVTVNSVDVDVDLAWWVYLLGGFVLPAIGEAIASAVASSVAHDRLSQALSNMQGINLDGAGGRLSFDSVAIHPQGIVLQGRTPVPAARTLHPALQMTEQDSLVSSIAVGTGSADHVNCTGNSYPYTDVQVTTRSVLRASTHDLGTPASFQWTVGGAVVSGSSGAVAFSAQGTGFDQSVVTSNPQINFELSNDGSQISLTNHPSDGNYAVDVECRATDLAGVTATTATAIHVNGEQRQFGGNYGPDTANCLQALRDALERIGHIYVWPIPIHFPGPGPDPGPDSPVFDPTQVADPVSAQILTGQFGAFLPSQVVSDLSAVARRAGVEASWLQQIGAIMPIRLIPAPVHP